MVMRSSRFGALVAACVGLAGLGNACGGGNGSNDLPEGADGGGYTGDDATVFSPDSGPPVGFMPTEAGGDPADTGTSGPDVNGPLVLSPENSAIDVDYGGTGAVQFTATINGYTVPASFSIDRGEL